MTPVDENSVPETPAPAAPSPAGGASASATPALVGQVLSGRYRILKLLGEGAMGAVYEAEHVHMRKRMAVKVLHAEMTRRPEIVERFEREAIAAGNIDHPNVAAATDFGRHDDGSFFLVLEYVVGKSLRDAIGRGGLELGRALHITRQIANAVGRAHELRIVHRDLKPENVMLVEREGDPDFVKVLDFGIAKVPVADLAEGAATGPALTRLGMIFGTPDYMAPEQAVGDAIDSRADLYSLGVVAFELLTGARPFEHDNAATLLVMQVSAPVPSMATVAPAAEVPPAVEAIVTRLLEKDPAQRFASAGDLVSALTQCMVDLAASGRIPPPRLGLADSSGAMSSRSLAAVLPHVSAVTAPTRLAVPSARTPLGDIVELLKPAFQQAQRLARQHAPGVSARTWLLGGIGASAAGLCVIVLVVALVWGRTTASGSSATTATPGLGHPDAALPGISAPDPIAVAEASLEKGDYPSAIAQLKQLELSRPDAAAVHHDLERAYMRAGDLKAALVEAQSWLASDHAAGRDGKFEEDVRAAALGNVDPDDAFLLLETRMGAVGADTLYDIGYGSTHSSAAERARGALAKPVVRRNAGPALAVTLDLRGARSCEAKRALLGHAREVGDARTSAVLKGYTSTSGCGFLGARDCWSCMHRDGALTEAIQAIDERVSRP